MNNPFEKKLLPITLTYINFELQASTLSVKKLNQIVSYIQNLEKSRDKQFTGLLVHCYKVTYNFAMFVGFGYVMRSFLWSMDKCKEFFKALAYGYSVLSEDCISFLEEYELILKRDLKLIFTDYFYQNYENMSPSEILLTNSIVNTGRLDKKYIK